jgi:hypothetical protein
MLSQNLFVTSKCSHEKFLLGNILVWILNNSLSSRPNSGDYKMSPTAEVCHWLRLSVRVIAGFRYKALYFSVPCCHVVRRWMQINMFILWIIHYHFFSSGVFSSPQSLLVFMLYSVPDSSRVSIMFRVDFSLFLLIRTYRIRNIRGILSRKTTLLKQESRILVWNLNWRY